MASAPARRELVRPMMGCGLSERRSLLVIRRAPALTVTSPLETEMEHSVLRT